MRACVRACVCHFYIENDEMHAFVEKFTSSGHISHRESLIRQVQPVFGNKIKRNTIAPPIKSTI